MRPYPWCRGGAFRTGDRPGRGVTQRVAPSAPGLGTRARIAGCERRVAKELPHGAALANENARLIEHAQRAAADLCETNQQLVAATIQAQEQAEHADAARARSERSEHELQEVAAFRERFIGILAHDLRNPLSAIGITAASLLRSSTLSDQDRNRVARITRGTQRMTRMISQLLDLTRARLGGGFPLDARATDLGDVCRGVVDDFGAAIDCRLEGNLLGLWDPDRLAEVISNIAGNAIEHATPGTSVILTARGEDSEAVVEISNEGEPIPADILPFIFEPFRQGTPMKQRATSGNLGLGLYIAKQIVMAAGGTLHARSSDGLTTFVVRLPRTRATSGKTRNAAWSLPAAEAL